jgi:flagellar assembly protein FliH
MTSSSDALWQPFVPAGPPALRLVPEPGAFTQPAVATHGATLEPPSWLPSLRSHVEVDADAARRSLEEMAYRRGLDEGARAERVRADLRCATALDAVARAAAHLEAIAAEFARDRERDAQAVALAAARHIVQHELTIDTLRVGELVRRAIELLPLDHVLEIRIHPLDLDTLRAGLDTMAPAGRNVRLEWRPDAAIDRGGFVIETPHRIIDGRADVALRSLYERLDHE